MITKAYVQIYSHIYRRKVKSSGNCPLKYLILMVFYLEFEVSEKSNLTVKISLSREIATATKEH